MKLSDSAAGIEFCEWVQVATDAYIPHCKYQVKLHLHPWFSTTCAATIAHRHHFSHLYQQNKSPALKVKFRQTRNCWKKVFKAAKLAYFDKTKESIISQKLGARNFWQISNSVFNKGKSAIPPLFNGPEVFLLLIKQNCLQKVFLRTLILITQIFLYLPFLLRLILFM